MGAILRPPAASASSVPLPPPHLQSTDKAKAGHRCANTKRLLGGALTAEGGGRGAWSGLIRTVSYSLAGKLLITTTLAECLLRGQCWSFAGGGYIIYFLINR